MSPISKKDKITWDNYVANLNKFSINFQHNKKSSVYNSKKTAYKKILLQNTLNPFYNKNIELEGIIDLHGYRLESAKMVLQRYIVNSFEKNLRNILVITGKGYNNTGVLRKEVPLWLNDRILSNLVINFKTAPKKFGGEGALIVRIKNKNKFRFL